MANDGINNVKKETKKFSNSGMTRQEASDAARLHIGDTCLLDYEINEQGNCWRNHFPSWCEPIN